MTRLSYLHSVGTGFAALIYELPMDADFKIFNEKCTTVRSFLMNNPRLEDTLVSSIYIIPENNIKTHHSVSHGQKKLMHLGVQHTSVYFAKSFT